MVSYPKSQFSKNNIKTIQSKSIHYNVKHVMKMMPSTVLNHGPNTTHLALMGVPGYPPQVYGLSTEGAVSRHLIILMTVRLDCVYGHSIKSVTSSTYQLQKYHAVLISHKTYPKMPI